MAEDDSRAGAGRFRTFQEIAADGMELPLVKARSARLEAKKEEIPLGAWADDRRGAPNVVLRSALFCAGKPPTKRATLSDHVLPVVAPYVVKYSGEKLYQPDLDVWLECVHRCRLMAAGAEASFTTHSFLRSLGLNGTGHKSYQALECAFKRLRFTMLHIETNKRLTMAGFLDMAELDKDRREWRIRLNPEIAAIFAPDQHTWLYAATRRAFGKSYLAKWLHGYFSSHRKPEPISVKRLHSLSGSSTGELKKFRQSLKSALDEVAFVEMGERRRFAWHIDSADLVHVSRGSSAN
jgi:hypothetical protein